MKKIGIFGDSFASLRFDNLNPSLDWVSHLSKNYDVTNFAKPGTSLYYSVKLFLENFEKFQKIVFIATHPCRLSLPNRSYFLDDNNHIVDCLTPRSAEQLLINCKDTAKRTILQSVIDYYIYLEDVDYNKYIANLMIEDIKSRHESVLVIDYNQVMQILEKENLHFKLDQNSIKKYYDYRNCHITAENNEILFLEIDNWISTGNFKFEIDNFPCQGLNFNLYFKKI